MSNSRLDALLVSLEQALKRLDAALARPADEYIRDSCIQRFEFTYELLWKALKVHLEERGVEVYAPKDTLREAFRAGLIGEDRLWLETVTLRNLAAHTYSESTAEEIYRALPPIARRYRELFDKLRAR